MTLCITYSHGSESLSVSDSQLTTVKGTTVDKGTTLPSDTVIAHTNNNAVKIHVVTKHNSGYDSRHDIVFAIAGNVSLGLHSTLNLDAYLNEACTDWYDHIIFCIESRLHDFWTTTRDKEVEYTVSLCDHKGHIRLFEAIGTIHDFTMNEPDEIPNLPDFSLSVIGDNKKGIRDNILSRVNSLCCTMELKEAMHRATLEAMIAAVEDPSNMVVGGNIQAVKLKQYLARYLVVKRGGYSLRGSQLREEDIRMDSYQTLDLDAFKSGASVL